MEIAYNRIAPTIKNRSGAYGLPQAMPGKNGVPGSKMATALLATDARDAWQYDPQVQLRWMIGYVHSRKARFGGTACGSAAFKFGWCVVGSRVLIAGISIPHQSSKSRPGAAGATCKAKRGVWHPGQGWY